MLESVKQTLNDVDPLIHHILNPGHWKKSDLLSKREPDVLESVQDGLTNHKIARKTDFADVTAGHHVQAVIRKLHAGNRTDSTVKAIREGLIE